MIYPYNNATQTQWGRGELQVQMIRNGQSNPVGFCDGTQEDEDEIRAQAEAEGVGNLPIVKKTLKTGRQIWTIGDPPGAEPGW